MSEQQASTSQENFIYNPISQGKVDFIYDQLIWRIISTHYTPGEMLNENALASEFNVSRTPVREALRRLQQENWLVMMPNIGMQVEPFDFNQLKGIFTTKEVLEILAIQQAIDYGTNADISELSNPLKQLEEAEANDYGQLMEIDFLIRSKIWSMSNNKILFNYLRDLHARIYRLWNFTVKQGAHIDKQKLYENLASIINSIEKRDKVFAEQATHNHMEYQKSEMRQNLF